MKKKLLFIYLIINIFIGVGTVSAKTIHASYYDSKKVFNAEEGDKLCYDYFRDYNGAEEDEVLYQLKDNKYEVITPIELDGDACFDVIFTKYYKNTKLGVPDGYILFTPNVTLNGLVDVGSIFPVYYARFELTCSKEQLKRGESAECTFSYTNPAIIDVETTLDKLKYNSGTYYYSHDFDYVFPKLDKIAFNINSDDFDISNVNSPLEQISSSSKYIFSGADSDSGVIATFTITANGKNKTSSTSSLAIDNLVYHYDGTEVGDNITAPQVKTDIGLVVGEETIDDKGSIKGVEENPKTGVEATNIVLGVLIVSALTVAYLVLLKQNKFKAIK